MKRTNKPQHTMLQNIRYLHQLGRSAVPHYRLLLCASALPQVLFPCLSVVLMKLLLDIVTGSAPLSAVFYSVGLYVLLAVLCRFAQAKLEQRIYYQAFCYRQHCIQMLIEKTIDTDYRNIESYANRHLLENATQFVYYGGQGAGAFLQSSKQLLTDLFGIFGLGAVLQVANPWILLTALFCAAVSFGMQAVISRQEVMLADEIYHLDEKRRYFTLGKPTDNIAGKDIRLYHLSAWFSPLLDLLLGDLHRFFRRKEKIRLKFALPIALSMLLRDGVTFFVLIRMAETGALTPGDFAFYFGAIRAFNQFAQTLCSDYRTLYDIHLKSEFFRAYLDLPEERRTGQKKNPPVACPPAIAFDHVSFSYDGRQDTIKDVSFSVKPGEKIAIVGMNGAGKTTCMKLLTGLYAPNKGAIYVDGKNQADFDRSTYYRLFSAVFQDAFLLPATLLENITLQPAAHSDRDRARAKLKEAGLAERVEQLEQGLDSHMVRSYYEDAAAFSGGELQKLFLARALYKEAPILILDEPTAALDPIAENELYLHFNQMTKDKTAFYISHRLSSTRFCDKILFFANGRLEEIGTHEQLMAAQGGYYKMYAAQSHYYQVEAAEV